MFTVNIRSEHASGIFLTLLLTTVSERLAIHLEILHFM